MTIEEFTSFFADIFEHSPWIPKKAAEARPFSTNETLYKKMVEVVKTSPRSLQLNLIKAHPNLGDRVAMSNHSTIEQQKAGLKDLTVMEYEKFLSLNKQYMEKFGFPFIIAVKGKDKQTIYQTMSERFHNHQPEEFETALSEIYKIALFRLKDKMEISQEEL